MSKIFAHASTAAAPVTTAVSAPVPAASSDPASTTPASPSPESAAPVPVATTGTVPAAQSVDVTAILDQLAAKNSDDLDWKKSIVDLLKLVGMDSGLSARKELAKDLDYSGDENDSATMNVWLHKEVLKKLGENGGKVPKGLLG